MDPRRVAIAPVLAACLAAGGAGAAGEAPPHDLPPRLHAILVDQGASMEPFREAIEPAVVEHVAALPASDELLRLAFAGELTLAGRERELGFTAQASRERTALRYALHAILRYLAPRSARKVVVVVTDGFDDPGAPAYSDDALVMVARAVSDLTLYAIRVRGKEGGRVDATPLLRRIAEATGGELFEARGRSAIAKALGAVRERTPVMRPGVSAVEPLAPAVEPLARSAPAPAVLDEFCGVGRVCWHPLEALLFPADVHLTLVSPPDYVAGRAPDGAEVRDFAIELPPFDEVRAGIRSPVDVLERWMERGGGGPSVFVEGRTWLELRPALAWTIRRARTDYQTWADARLAVLGSAAAESALAEWLADVPARDLALGLEARIANRLRLLGAPERAAARERLEGFWPSLAQWFPSGAASRVVTPLIPIYDERRNVVGFDRIVLPHDFDPLPPYPLGVRILERLLGDRALAAELARGVEIAGVGFRPVVLGGARRGTDAGATFESSLCFETEEGPVRLDSLLALGPGGTLDLLCLRPGASDAAGAFARRLREFVRESALSCAARLAVRPAEGGCARPGT